VPSSDIIKGSRNIWRWWITLEDLLTHSQPLRRSLDEVPSLRSEHKLHKRWCSSLVDVAVEDSDVRSLYHGASKLGMGAMVWVRKCDVSLKDLTIHLRDCQHEGFVYKRPIENHEHESIV